MWKRLVSEGGLWLLAFIVTIFSAGYQRRTGPTHPIEGRVELAGSPVDFTLLRSHGGSGDQPVEIIAPDTLIHGAVLFKRYKTNDAWTRIDMQRQGEKLAAALPHQPPAGKLEYHVELRLGEQLVAIPEKENAVTRFKGAVPAWALIPHIIFIFLSMLLAARVGLQALRKEAPLMGLMSATIICLVIGGFIFGPIVQKFAFGAYWTGFPFGMDLTDNKTLIALIAWIAAFFLLKRNRKNRLAVAAAFMVMFTIFMIPHSMHGSELDYSTLDEENAPVQVSE